jgi:hypothetical protein
MKKKYLDTNYNSSNLSSKNFLVNTFQKTKHNLSKFESRLTNAFNKENSHQNSNSKHSKQALQTYNDDSANISIATSLEQTKLENEVINEVSYKKNNHFFFCE